MGRLTHKNNRRKLIGIERQALVEQRVDREYRVRGKKERVAVLVPYAEFSAQAGKRPLGLLKGRATFSVTDDFMLTDDEFLAA